MAGSMFAQPKAVAAATLILLLSLVTLHAQSNVGQIAGTVTDASGGVIPGASVAVVHLETNLTRTAVTDENGSYVVTNLPVGAYTVTATMAGFTRSAQTGHELTSDGRLTVDLALKVGDVADRVEVTAVTGETVNTTSGEVARVIDEGQVQNLALNGRNYIQLLTLVPGAPLLDFDAVADTTDVGVSQPINGGRGDTNNVTVDGGFNLLKANNTGQSHNVGVDFIQEVKVQTSNFSAEYGRQSGASINVVTRSGTNQFHGSLFEFLRNDRLDARNFFAPEKRALRFNNFGYSLGGPFIKNKFFFFGGQEWKYVRRDLDPLRRTLPTRAERRGDFSGRAGLIRDPLFDRSVPCTAANRAACFPGNRIPAERVTPDGRAIAAIYDAMEQLAVSYMDTPIANNAIYQLASPFDGRQDILRLDYRLNEKHSLFVRYLHDKNILVNPLGTSVNSPLPTTPTRRPRPTHSGQVSHTWLISPRYINEAKLNSSQVHSDTRPLGDLWKRATYGFAFQQLFDSGRFDNGIPDLTFGGTGTVAGVRGPAPANTALAIDTAVSDHFTIIRRRHTIKTGASFVITRNDQEGRVTAFYTGAANFNPQGNSRTTGNAFADALLGNFRTYSEISSPPETYFRSRLFEAYVSDGWKAHPRLTLEAGVRYHYIGPLYTVADNLSNFDPARYDPARAVTVTRAGEVVPGSGDPFNGLVRAGRGAPAGDTPAARAVPAGAPRGLYPAAHRWAPRLSFAYAPSRDNKTAVRGGFGVFFNSARGDITQRAGDNPPFVTAAQFEDRNLSDLTAALPVPFGTVSALDPRLNVTYSMNYSLSLQRELPRGVFVEAAYIGNLGRHLLRRPDVNQPPFEVLAANAARPLADQSQVNALRPFKGYSQILMYLTDATSNYNALQLYVTKRKGDLTMTGSYTWSRTLADASGQDENPEEPFNRRYNYGPTSFHRQHIAVATYTYRLPFLRGRDGWRGALLAGYEVSGITRFQSGNHFTVTGNSSIGARRADYVGGAIDLPRGDRTADRWFNTDAFRRPPDDRRGTSGVRVVKGPGLQVWDLSLRKRWRAGERVGLLFQADLFNAFNRPNFLGLNVNASSVDFGSVTTAAPGRNVQFGMKLTF